MRSSTRTGYLLSIGAAVVWAATSPGIKYLLDHRVPALAIAFWRDALIALACMVALLAVKPLLLRVSLRELAVQVYLPTLLPLIPTLIVLELLSQAVDTPSLLNVAAVGSAGVLTYVGCYLLLGSSSLERDAGRDVARTAFRFLEARLRSPKTP